MPPGALVRLEEDEMHVWHIPLDQISHDYAYVSALLSQDECRRAARYRFEKDRAEYCLSRGVLRLLLQRYGIAPAKEIRFVYSAKGKPDLDNGPESGGLQFNVSHSHGMAVIAFTRGRPIGVDVELIRATKDADGLVARFFAEEERSAYAALPAADRLRAFFLGWTRKEAFVKATGEGLGFPLDSFAVTLTPTAPPRFLRIDCESTGVAAWSLADLTIDPRYAVAVATRATGLLIQNRLWRLDHSKS